MAGNGEQPPEPPGLSPFFIEDFIYGLRYGRRPSDRILNLVAADLLGRLKHSQPEEVASPPPPAQVDEKPSTQISREELALVFAKAVNELRQGNVLPTRLLEAVDRYLELRTDGEPEPPAQLE